MRDIHFTLDEPYRTSYPFHVQTQTEVAVLVITAKNVERNTK